MREEERGERKREERRGETASTIHVGAVCFFPRGTCDLNEEGSSANEK